MSCSPPLILSSPTHTSIYTRHNLQYPQLPLSIYFSHPPPTFKSHICCFSSSNPNPTFDSQESQWLREEQRWLREEQRWLREEQRWLREEQRWILERELLLHQVLELEMRIQVLEGQNSVQGGSVSMSETISSIMELLQVLKENNLIVETASSSTPIVLVEEKCEEEIMKEPEAFRVFDEIEKVEQKIERKKKTLKIGSEGDDVRAMQEALQNLGFYSGEEDIEFSSFSSGTEQAVKTWQATLGAPEDGIMTEELMERLYMEQEIDGVLSNINADKEESVIVVPKEVANGASVASVTEISKAQQTIVEEGVKEVEESKHQVFLLGENRWEEPSRLAGWERKTGEATTKCLSCRGEGRIMCTECDGSGEPNLEPQFLEWVEEGTKCPYCEGLGYTICDTCGGKLVA